MSIEFAYLPTDKLCMYGENVYRRERHYSDTGEIFVAIDIITGNVNRGITNETKVNTVSKDHVHSIILKHVLKKRKTRCTKRQFIYVDTRIKHPEYPKTVCARKAGYSESMSMHATELIERRCKKIFSSHKFIASKICELYGLDDTGKTSDSI
jgi:hypothetical protein